MRKAKRWLDEEGPEDSLWLGVDVMDVVRVGAVVAAGCGVYYLFSDWIPRLLEGLAF